MKKIYYLFIFITIATFPLNVFASKGCCSRHGGQSYCGDDGYWVCADGTQSPSCTCGEINLNYILKDTNTCDNYKNEIESQEEIIDEQKEKINSLQKEKDNINEILILYRIITWSAVIIFTVGYYYSKKK